MTGGTFTICILSSALPIRRRRLLTKTNAQWNRENGTAIKLFQQKKHAVLILTRLSFTALSKSHSLSFDSLGGHFGRRESGYNSDAALDLGIVLLPMVGLVLPVKTRVPMSRSSAGTQLV